MLQLGKILKKLRIQNDLTQEQLAEACGVSPQAVSRWETGATYPDITILPVIANYFDVTTDDLLGVNTERKQREIDKILEHDAELHRCGKITESIAFLREKISRYPKSAAITYALAHSLYMKLCSEAPKSEDGLNEVVSLTNKAILLDRGESHVTPSGKQQLCLAYVMFGRYEEAYDIAVNMPSLWVSREVMLPHALRGDEELVQRQHSLLTFMDVSILNLCQLSRRMDDPEKSIALLKKAVALAELLTGADHKFYNERVFQCHLGIAKHYAAMGSAGEALENLKLALNDAELFETRPERSAYEVFWLDGYVDDRSKTSKSSEETLYQHLLDALAEEPFASLHANDAYAGFVEAVRAKSGIRTAE